MEIAPSGVPDGYWSVVLQNVKVGSESVLRTKASAILDTGTSMVVGPYQDVGYVANMIGAYCVAFSGYSSSSVTMVRVRKGRCCVCKYVFAGKTVCVSQMSTGDALQRSCVCVRLF